jgi:UDP-N-acetylglucosamine 2-epimerase (non-hydrolysing)
MHKILLVFGTRPEAIKLCPVVRCLRESPAQFDVKVCVTAQHRGMLDQVLEAFEVKPDYDLDLMLPGQTLFQSTSRILAGLENVLHAERPGMVIVQGDTTTFCGALAAFYSGAPVAHVEAGLRTGDLHQPFPEEMNRVLTSHRSAFRGDRAGRGKSPQRRRVPGFHQRHRQYWHRCCSLCERWP